MIVDIIHTRTCWAFLVSTVDNHSPIHLCVYVCCVWVHYSPNPVSHGPIKYDIIYTIAMTDALRNDINDSLNTQ